MLRISWTEHVTNEEVFNRANTKPTLLDGLLKRRLAFHGHLVRKGGITLDLMIGRLHGNRPRGRPRTTWLKDLATQANISYKEAMTTPRDRKKWRSVGNAFRRRQLRQVIVIRYPEKISSNALYERCECGPNELVWQGWPSTTLPTTLDNDLQETGSQHAIFATFKTIGTT